MAAKLKGISRKWNAVKRGPDHSDDAIPEISASDLARASIWQGDVMVSAPRKPGRRAGTGRKEGVTIRFDKDIMAYYRSTGRGWQTRMNLALRATLPKRYSASKAKH